MARNDFSEKAMSEMLHSYRNWIYIGVAILVVAGVSYGIWDRINASQRREAAAEFYQLEKAYKDKVSELEKAKGSDATSEAEKQIQQLLGQDQEKTVGTFQDYAAVVEDLKQFALENPTRESGFQAALLAIQIHDDFDQFEGLDSFLNQFGENARGDHFLAGLFWMSKGNVHARLNQCDKAVTAWATLTQEKNFKYLVGEASLRSGLCYEKMGEKQKAMDMYQAAVDAEPGSLTAAEAEKFLRALRMDQTLTDAQNTGAENANL